MPIHKRVEIRPLPPLPYKLSATGLFEGDDGKWSTFFINIGDADGTGSGQDFRVLPSTSSPTTLIPRQAEWCVDDCPKLRGIGMVNGQQPKGVELSSSWQEKGIFEIPTPWGWSAANMTDTWETTPNGLLGTDNVGLGESSRESPVFPRQYVLQYEIKDFFFGSFGLAVGAFGPQGASLPNFLDSLYASDPPRIASRSYAYTAGAYYRNNNNGILGSLLFGGYDKSRMSTSGVSIRMPSDKNNTLALGVQSIIWKPDPNIEANAQALNFDTGAFPAIIDSTLPYLILPDAVCDGFATKFGLGYDEDLRLYTVNASAHERNVRSAADMVFSISPGVRDSNNFAAITIPYAAFDQNLSSPLADPSIRYLPIKRSDDGIYVLGRTFLQEAYLIVDYERRNFTIAPAYSPKSDDIPTESLVTIFNQSYVPDQSPSPSDSGGLSAGAIAGIVVGIILAFAIAGIAAFFYWRKKSKADKTREKPSEIDTVFAGTEVKHRRVSELTGSEAPHSPKDSTVGYYGDPKMIPPISEMSPDSTPAELYSPPGDSERDSYDYFAASGVRRRGATRDRDSSSYNTPQTPLAELPGEDMRYSSTEHQPDLKHSRGPSDTSLSAKIDGVLAGQKITEPQEQHPAVRSSEKSDPGDAHQSGEIDPNAVPERRPSHTRGLSDTTVQSDSTAISQPTPEELERWAKTTEDGPQRPMSP